MTFAPLAPTRKSRSAPVSAPCTWSMYSFCQPRSAFANAPVQRAVELAQAVFRVAALGNLAQQQAVRGFERAATLLRSTAGLTGLFR